MLKRNLEELLVDELLRFDATGNNLLLCEDVSVCAFILWMQL